MELAFVDLCYKLIYWSLILPMKGVEDSLEGIPKFYTQGMRMKNIGHFKRWNNVFLQKSLRADQTFYINLIGKMKIPSYIY